MDPLPGRDGTSVADDPYVASYPGVCGGYPVVRGTRTPVRVIVAIHRQLGDFESTARWFSYLRKEQIQGALDYYAKHPARVDEDFARNARSLAELQGRPWPA